MGWDKGRYYTRSKKVNGRVVREYVGKGRIGELAAQLDAFDRERRQTARESRRAKLNELKSLDSPLEELDALVTVLARAALLAAGYHQHRRGEWRRRRVCSQMRKSKKNPAMRPLTEVTTKEKGGALQILQRAQRGDESTLPELRRMLTCPEVVDFFGNLAEQAERSLIDATAGKNVAAREGLLRKLEMLREELAGPSPTSVERLLVERIVACWLQVQDADIRFAQAKDVEIEWGDYFQRRMDRAHRRYLSAIKTLAHIRKFAIPVLQVNIGQKQVNLAGSYVAGNSETGENADLRDE